MDHYPFFENPPAGFPNASTDGYHKNLGLLRESSLAHGGVPFWNFFNAIPFQTHMAPTAGMTAWQAFTSLAYGAKGVLYFTYWAPGHAASGQVHRSLADVIGRSVKPDSSSATIGGGGAGLEGKQGGLGGVQSVFTKGGGLISPSAIGLGAGAKRTWGPTAQYGYARDVNSLLLNFGNFLFEYTSTAVWRVARGGNASSVSPLPPQLCPIVAVYETDSSGTPVAAELQGEYLVGLFQTPGKLQTAALIVNQRFDIELWPTVDFSSATDPASVHEVDPVSGKLRLVKDDSPDLPGLQMALAPGSARLLVFV